MRAARGVFKVYGMFVTSNAYWLYSADNGIAVPYKAGGRLAAFKATGNAAPNTWKKPVHVDIACIYLLMGERGSECIGDIFESAEMQQELNKDTSDKEASLAAATLEFKYWKKCRLEDSLSLGGFLGSSFTPATRNVIQQTTAQALSCLGQLE